MILTTTHIIIPCRSLIVTLVDLFKGTLKGTMWFSLWGFGPEWVYPGLCFSVLRPWPVPRTCLWCALQLHVTGTGTSRFENFDFGDKRFESRVYGIKAFEFWLLGHAPKLRS